MILVISRGIGQGRQVALATAVGCVSAGAVQIPLLALGLASIINASTMAHEILRWIGAAYLFYLGAALLLRRANGEALAEEPRTTASVAFWQGVVSNLTNPTTLAFMLALLPQFVDPSRGSTTGQLVVLGVTMKATGMIVLGSVALAAGSAGKWICRRPTFIVWQEPFCGATMIGLAIYLLSGTSLRTR
jgi:threonine/homoserine/homoserine lactone efflux protein